MTLPELLDAFTLPFISRGLLVIAVLAVCSGIISVFVHFRGMEFITDGLVHAVFPGLVVGYLLGGTAALMPAALVAALLAVALITLLTHRGLLGNDAAVAVLLTSAFSLGVVLVSRQHDYMAQLSSLLFGHLLTVTEAQLLQVTVIALAAVALVLGTWRRQLFRAHDPQGFAAAGFNPLITDLILGAAIAMVVVAGATALGNLLIIALLIVPAATAQRLTTNLSLLTVLAAMLTVLAGIVGIGFSVWMSFAHGINVSAGGAVVLTLVLFYVLAVGYSAVRPSSLRPGGAG